MKILIRTVLMLSAIATGALALATLPARALVEIDVNKGIVEPLPIAVADFISGDGTGAEITSIIAADLKRSGLFAPIDKGAFIEKISNPDVAPRFEDWKVINAQALVTGRVTQEADGRLRAEFRLWDTFAGQQLVGEQFFANKANTRRVAHIIADAIYERLTGEKGYFDTRIVFIDESGPKGSRVKRLAIMDQDGAGVRYLSDGRSIAMTPRFSPDGQRVIMSLLRDDGNSNIFAMDLRSRTTTRLTNSNAIDTSPSDSPDGTQVVFTSDRGGRAQIYVMGADGANQQRISFGDGTYSTPVWSPRGDLIAFTKQSGGEFQIGVMRPDGSGERILTSGFQQEGPTWAPNGRVLMFFREAAGSGGPRLYSIDLTGRNEQPIPTQNFASDPAWSPLLE